jgi:hypothetical protein
MCSEELGSMNSSFPSMLVLRPPSPPRARALAAHRLFFTESVAVAFSRAVGWRIACLRALVVLRMCTNQSAAETRNPKP